MTMSTSSSSSSYLYVVFMVSLVLAVSAQSFDCSSGNALNSLVPKFTMLSVFPSNPVKVGQQVHIRTVVSLSSGMKGPIVDGSILMDVQYNDQDVFTLPNIPLCTSTPSIDCTTLKAGDNTITFDYTVPKIPAGKYTITLRISFNQTTQLSQGCLSFSVNVQDPDASKDMYKSWISAELAGVSQFDHEDYLDRSLEENVQIGPMGSIDANTAYTFPWGTFISLQGSQDLIQPYFNPQGYVWGLSGTMEQITYQGLTREQVYNGTFWVGYVSSLSKRTLDISILNGTFLLSWFITTDADGIVHSKLSGNISFDDVADLPLGFSNPITVGRLGMVNIWTDNAGKLQMTGSENVCMANKKCNTVGASKSGDGLSGWQIGLITGIIVGIALIFIVVIAAIKWYRRSKRHEAEDGIFAARRKPEYGNALVVDDIIQETREHSPNIMPPLYVRDADLTDSDTDSDDFSRSRSRSRTPSRSRSPSPPSYSDRRGKSPSRERSRSASRSYDSEDYTDDDSSASRA